MASQRPPEARTRENQGFGPRRPKRGPKATKSGPRGPREAQEPPRARGRPGRPRRSGPGARPRRGPGARRAARKPKMAPERSPGEIQEGPRGGPGKAQEGPWSPTGPGHRGKDKRTQEETGQEQTRPAAGRDNILTKGLPGPLNPEPLSPYPTYFSCI